MLTARAELRASCNRIPRALRPFDFGRGRHELAVSYLLALAHYVRLIVIRPAAHSVLHRTKAVMCGRRGDPQRETARLLFLLELVASEQRHPALRITQQSRLAINAKLVARIGDIQAPHGELADAVGGGEEDFLALLHRQALGLVGEVRARRILDGVVVAAA